MFPRALFKPNPYSRGTRVFSAPASGLLDLLPTANRLAIWYAGDGSGGGSYISATDGAAVDSWTDAVAGYAPSQTGSNRPTYRQSVAAFNNRGAVEFSTAAQTSLALSLSGGLVASLSVYTAYIVFLSSATVAGDMYGEFKNDSNTPTVIARYNYATGVAALRSLHRSDANVSANIQGGSGFGDGTAHLFTLKRTASNAFESYGDGSSLGTSSGAPGTTTVNVIALGRFGGTAPGATHFTGQLAAVILYSADNRTTVEPILNTHYGM